MNKFIKFVGLDVHKATIAVSVAATNNPEVRFLSEIENTHEALSKMIRQLQKDGSELAFCYEAGPCGYGIHRFLTDLGWRCDVVAPSLIPKKAGDRIKTDRRDSMSLARLMRAGELTPVWVPDGAQEALRDLVRAREDIRSLQRQTKQRLLALLLRHEIRWQGKGKCNWTKAHFSWLETVKMPHPTQQIVFQIYLDTILRHTKQVADLDRQIRSAAQESVFWPIITALMALRGICLLNATTIVAEIGDLRRFSGAPQLMAFLGLVPSEHSSGASRSRGGITKTGNSHVRRALVEAAWTYRFPARKTPVLAKRAREASEEVQAIAWRAQMRLCGRYRGMTARGKLKQQTCTAIARELAGFIWAIGQCMPAPGQGVVRSN